MNSNKYVIARQVQLQHRRRARGDLHRRGVNNSDGDIAREVARDVAGGACGTTVAPDDAVGLANVIEQLADGPGACARMGVAARAMFEAEFTPAITIGKWRGVLEGVRG